MKKETPVKTQPMKPVKKKKYVKWIVITAVVVAVAVAAVIILPKFFGEKTTSTRITTYNANEVTYGNISQTVSGSGTLTPVTSETLTSSKGGDVEKVSFTVGDEVKKDAEIAVINGESITAPCDGILLELPLKVGDEVAQGGSVAMVMGKDGFTMGIAVDETEISSIKLDLEKQGRKLILTVNNPTLTPVSEDDLHHVFDRFYRTDSSRNSETGGHGIGLSMAQAIAAAHKGKISATSGDGNSFTVKVIFTAPAEIATEDSV